jgi:hypothetical protein
MPRPGVSLPTLLSLNSAPLAGAALAYAQLGIAVFPLVPRAKEPLVAGSFYQATTAASQIQRWWKRWPQANIGIATGKPSGWWVLDIDPRHGGLCSLEAMERHARDWGAPTPLGATLRQLTGGGGVHLVYQRPPVDLEPPNGCFAGYHGIDFKKGGGYVVGAPSIHPTGGVYQWQNDALPAPFPPALLDLFIEYRQRQFSRASMPPVSHTRSHEVRQSDLDRERDPEYWLHAALRHAAPGRRHNYALFLAIQLVEAVGCSFEEAEFWMREYVAQVANLPTDPYDLEDALDCLAYAWNRCYGG